MTRSQPYKTSGRWNRVVDRLRKGIDFESALPYIAWMKQPLGVLLLLGLAALLCGLLVAPSGYAVLAAVVVVIVVGCIWPWIGVRGVSCQLRFAAPRTEEGKAVEAELVITNRWPWPVWGLAVEGGLAPAAGESDQPAIAISRVAGWSRGYFRWPFVPPMRGRYPVASPQLVTEFPFGLYKARRQAGVPSRLIVWPERFPLPPLVLTQGRQSWAGQPAQCTTGNQGHRTTVRDYRHGDSMRQIHWTKTALHDRLVSYEREGFAITDASIWLDTHPTLHRGVGRDASIEWTIRIAASICETLCRQGVSVTVATHSGQFRAHATGSPPTDLLDWFAELDCGDRTADRSTDRPRFAHGERLLTIHITTDLSNKFASDSIVVLTEPGEHPAVEKRRLARSWMTVGADADIPGQVHNGWRNGRRRLRHAV